MQDKKISPQAIMALKEALSVLFWKKEELRDFVKLTLNNPTFVGTIDWVGPTKREIVKELIERMTNNPKIFGDGLLSLLIAVTDFTDFPHLVFWDDDGSKRKKAKEAVEQLRKHTKGYIQITKEKDEAKKRQRKNEERIAKNKSLEEELNELKNRFYQIASNTNLQKRGYELEGFLNELFALYELNPRGSFKIYGEQIDGAFTFDGTDYLLEAKWKKNVDRTDLSSFSLKVDSKIKVAMGLLITIDGLTPEAISPEFKSMIIMDGVDISAILEGRVKLPDLLYKKRRKAVETGDIYINFYNL